MAICRTLLMMAVAAPLLGCASQPDANATDPAQGLEERFQEAARAYRVVQRDGRTLYCKHEKVIGSTIPTTQCLTEGQLRLQVEYDQQMRERMRAGAHCAMGRRGGASGCAGS